MERQITPEQLAANVREVLRDVKRGEVLTIVDDGEPIATVRTVDNDSWIIRHDPALKLSDFEPGEPLIPEIDAVEMLIAERDYERSGKKYS